MKANLDIMSVSSLVIELHAAQQRLTLALQAEYFCDDLDLPPEAYGWGEARIRSFYESGGEATLDLTDSVVPLSAPSVSAPLFLLAGVTCKVNPEKRSAMPSQAHDTVP